MRLALAVLLVASATCHAADLYRVAGTVINVQTHTPIPHAQVYFSKTGTAAPRAPFITQEDGRFSFDVPEGAYTLRAGTRVAIQTYGARAGGVDGFGSALIVGAANDTSNVEFKWSPPATISGRVLDESGEPAENALVQLIHSGVIRGHIVTRTVQWARADDRGEYRFGRIPGDGRYYLAVTGTPWYDASIRLAAARQPQQPSVAFVPVFYPNTQSAAQATPIVLAPGEEARADFTLTPAAGAALTVSAGLTETFSGNLSLTRDGIEGIDSFQQSQGVNLFPKQNTPSLSGIPPGHYTVYLTGKSAGGSLSGHTAIDINGSDVTVDIALHPESAVSGTVQFLPAKPERPTYVTLAPEVTGSQMSASIKPDGSFTFPAVAHGTYRIAIGGVAGFVSRIEVTGASYRDGLLTVTEGETISVSAALSSDYGRISGFAMNGDKPAAAVFVVLAPVNESKNPARYLGNQTESDGSFIYPLVPPGDYYAFAVENTAFEYANPDVVRPYLANAQKITVVAHQSLADQHISVTPILPVLRK